MTDVCHFAVQGRRAVAHKLEQQWKGTWYVHVREGTAFRHLLVLPGTTPRITYQVPYKVITSLLTVNDVMSHNSRTSNLFQPRSPADLILVASCASRSSV
jgi:hypothetical protein